MVEVSSHCTCLSFPFSKRGQEPGAPTITTMIMIGNHDTVSTYTSRRQNHRYVMYHHRGNFHQNTSSLSSSSPPSSPSSLSEVQKALPHRHPTSKMNSVFPYILYLDTPAHIHTTHSHSCLRANSQISGIWSVEHLEQGDKEIRQLKLIGKVVPVPGGRGNRGRS